MFKIECSSRVHLDLHGGCWLLQEPERQFWGPYWPVDDHLELRSMKRARATRLPPAEVAAERSKQLERHLRATATAEEISSALASIGAFKELECEKDPMLQETMVGLLAHAPAQATRGEKANGPPGPKVGETAFFDMIARYSTAVYRALVDAELRKYHAREADVVGDGQGVCCEAS